MRVRKNLSVYFDGLTLEAVNELWSRMVDLKTNIDGTDYIYNKSDERFEKTPRWKDAKALGEGGIRYQVKKIDIRMREWGKEALFGTSKDQKLTEEDYRQIIDRYRFLMSDLVEEQKSSGEA